jgi:hypothetical protein
VFLPPGLAWENSAEKRAEKILCSAFSTAPSAQPRRRVENVCKLEQRWEARASTATHKVFGGGSELIEIDFDLFNYLLNAFGESNINSAINI